MDSYDAWKEFEVTGRIEDYIKYRRDISNCSAEEQTDDYIVTSGFQQLPGGETLLVHGS